MAEAAAEAAGALPDPWALVDLVRRPDARLLLTKQGWIGKSGRLFTPGKTAFTSTQLGKAKTFRALVDGNQEAVAELILVLVLEQVQLVEAGVGCGRVGWWWWGGV